MPSRPLCTAAKEDNVFWAHLGALPRQPPTTRVALSAKPSNAVSIHVFPCRFFSLPGRQQTGKTEKALRSRRPKLRTR